MALPFGRDFVDVPIFPSWVETGGELGPNYTTEGSEPLRPLVRVFYHRCN